MVTYSINLGVVCVLTLTFCSKVVLLIRAIREREAQSVRASASYVISLVLLASVYLASIVSPSLAAPKPGRPSNLLYLLRFPGVLLILVLVTWLYGVGMERVQKKSSHS